MENELKTKIPSQRACIGVIGLGYVGLPLVLRFSRQGFKVLGFDTDQEKVQALNAGSVLYQTYLPRRDCRTGVLGKSWKKV